MRPPPLLLVALCARLAAAQAPDAAPRAPGTTVSGVVRDSVARGPLVGAMVQLVAADSLGRFSASTTSDSLGRFGFGGVPDGRYMLGFLHPMLDSLGLEPPVREVSVEGGRPVHADLGIPSPSRLRAAICGARPVADSGAVIVGVVRDARDGAPAAGARVTGEWLEISFTPSGVERRTPRLVATSGQNGWFAICDVPRAGTMLLAASRGADSTDLVEVQVPAEGFLRRELYLGAARAAGITDAAPGADSLARPPRRVRAGDGTLRGTVVTTTGGQPLAGAQVSLVDGPQTRANERGEWTLADAPVGTRMLEVRAVGYYSERRPVDVVPGAPPVRVSLATLKAVLDTIRVSATRYDRDRDGFQARRRSGAGRYLTADDVARQRPIVASDVFRNVAGVRLEYDADRINQVLSMRGPFGACSPAIFINGHQFSDLTAGDIDTWMRPSEIAGIEIYSEAAVPVRFRRLVGRPDDPPCGSIVIWTK